jgi:exonuclease SbcD
MKILHTSDWHLGRSLYSQKRYQEFADFLDWLADTVTTEQVDTLLIAGDVFDTSTPSNRAQALYYQFLSTIANSCCQHVVIIAGNHDSPSFLNAPKALLKTLNVHVVGAITDCPADEVLLLQNTMANNINQPLMDEQPPAQSTLLPPLDTKSAATTDMKTEHLLVCAVPYLRDKDIRTATPGETIDDKNTKLIEGVRSHYAEVVTAAVQKQQALQKSSITKEDEGRKGIPAIPIVGMGHLFTAGGQTIDGDGVRELYVGSLAHVGKDIFPEEIDYMALGHLHVPQAVGGAEHIRYSGSPIAMGFGEAKQQKSVVLVEFDTDTAGSGSLTPEILQLPVPCFQQLMRLTGSTEEILTAIETLKAENSNAWLEVEYTGKEVISNLRELLDTALEGSAISLLRTKNTRLFNRALQSLTVEEALDDLNPSEVFTRCLEAFEVPAESHTELTACYNEVLQSLQEADPNAE